MTTRPSRAAQPPGLENAFVQLAAELSGCLAFEPKKWRKALEASNVVLASSSKAHELLPAGGHRSQQQQQQQCNELRPGKKRPRASLPSDNRPASAISSDRRASRPSSRDEDAGVVLPSVHPGRREAPLALRDYLNQPAMVRAILDEANAAEELGAACDEQQAPESGVQSAAERTDAESARRPDPTPRLPLLRTVSPRTRQGLARLPPATRADLDAIDEMESFAASKQRSRAFYQSLRTQQQQLRRRGVLGSPVGVSDHVRRAQRPPRTQLAAHNKRVARRPGPRDERVRMAMEDVDVADDRTRETATLPPAATRSHLERRQLLLESASASADEAAAQAHVDRALAEIRRLLPLEVVYAFGKGAFASPAQQRAATVLFRAGARLRFARVVHAVGQWKRVTADAAERERAAAALRLQCCWRQVRAVRECATRRRIRQELRKRQEALVRMLASKQSRAAAAITRAIRRYAGRRRHQKLARRVTAATTIQRFWRQRQASWVALRIHLRKTQRRKAAVCIQRHVRSRLARRRRRLLQKIRRVDVQREQRAAQASDRRRGMLRLGAALAIQRAFRRWRQHRVLALRRRRAQFERDQRQIRRVQAVFRGRQARAFFVRHLLAVHNAALTLQRAWRCCLARRVRCALEAARAEQRRRWAAEVEERRHKSKSRVAAANQQVKKTWNQLVVLKDQRRSAADTRESQAAAALLQARWRGLRTRRRIRHEKARERELQRRAANRRRRLAATCIQRRVRGVQGRAKAWGCVVHRSARRIQSAWRGFHTRRELQHMRSALRAIATMQHRWRQRCSTERQHQRTRAAAVIQRRARVLLGRRWLRTMVRRQQVLAEEQAMGRVLLAATRRRVKDELLLQSFVFADIVATAASSRADASLFRADRRWQRRGYDGVWQQVFRDAAGGSAEIDSSRFARLLKALPHAFVHPTRFPAQTADVIFARMKEPKARALSFARFTRAINAVLRAKFASGDRSEAEDLAVEHTRYLRFMHEFVLPSTLQGGKYRETLDAHCTQRILWAVATLARLARRLVARRRHDRFLALHRARKERERRVRCANAIGTCYRRFRFRAQLQTALAGQFVEYVDYRGQSVRFEHVRTGKYVARRPVFLRGVACAKVVPLPFPGEEFRAFCERHNDGGATAPADVYCVECEDAMCARCFARDHAARQALRRHEQRRIRRCSHCCVETATRECLQCGDGRVPFCDACFPHVHRAKAAHSFRPIVVLCVECAARAAQWRCETCEDAYCKRCLSSTHARGQRQHHRCHRLSYFSVLKQLAADTRAADAHKERETHRRAREQQREADARREQLRHASATKIQALVRSFVARQHGRAYMRLVRQTQAAKAQRVKDAKVRGSVAYRLKGVFGLSPALKSDTRQEVAARRQRFETVRAALFAHRRVLGGGDDDNASPFERKKKRWTARKKAQALQAARSWCVYGVRVKVRSGAWKASVGTILSTQNLLATGFVIVFLPLAHRSVVVSWEQLAPFDDDERLRQPYEPPARALADAAHDFRARLTRVVEHGARKARLLYLQTVEFRDVAAYAWVAEYNKRAQREEFWNVVLDKRTFEAPRAMELVERMEPEQRQEVEARVALAKAKLLDLLHPFQPKNKPTLARRRGARVYVSAASRPPPKPPADADEDEAEEKAEADEDHAGALSCARWWHETIAPHHEFGGKKASRFLSACVTPPHSTRACWRVLRVWQWMDLYEADGYEPHAKTFFGLADELQLYVADELRAPMDAGNSAEARDKLLQLLKLKEETLQLLVFNAAQQRAAADEALA